MFRIAFEKFNGQVFGLGPNSPAFQQSWNIVSADSATTAPCGRECRVSASRGNIQYAPTGLQIGRFTALSEAFFQHLVRRVFPGGCLFATVATQLAPHASQVRDRVMKMQGEWVAMFIEALRQACDDGELQPDADLNQLVFEITAMMFRANFAWIVTADERVLDQARTGIRNILSRVAGKKSPGARARQPKKEWQMLRLILFYKVAYPYYSWTANLMGNFNF